MIVHKVESAINLEKLAHQLQSSSTTNTSKTTEVHAFNKHGGKTQNWGRGRYHRQRYGL